LNRMYAKRKRTRFKLANTEATAEIDGIMGNVTNKETDKASFPALANRPDFFLLVSTGGLPHRHDDLRRLIRDQGGRENLLAGERRHGPNRGMLCFLLRVRFAGALRKQARTGELLAAAAATTPNVQPLARAVSGKEANALARAQ
jgi:hypothetical protein